MCYVACLCFWFNLSIFVTRGGCLLRFALSNIEKTKLFQPACSGLSEMAPLSSLFTGPVQAHLPLPEKHTQQQHTQMFLGVCMWVCFSHMVTSPLCLTVQLLSLSSWSSCDPESCSFRISKTMLGQLSVQSDFTYLASLHSDSLHSFKKENAS